MKKTLASLIIFLTLSGCATPEKTKKGLDLKWEFKEDSACLKIEDIQKLREELIRCQR